MSDDQKSDTNRPGQREAYYGLPSEVKFCKKCVISNQRPSSTIEFRSAKGEKKKVINFDENGICSACVFQAEKEKDIDWQDRDEKLRALLDQFRSTDGSYDVIVPGSGGKDSAFTAHILKYKYGMNPLTVTWAPHLYTDIGWKNFEEWMHTGGLDNILYTPNGVLHREMTRNAFHNLLHPFQPFIVGQRIIGPAMARKFGVKLVMYGENQAEYGNAIEENINPIMNMDFFSIDDPLEMKFGDVSMQDYIDTGRYSKNDFAPYIPPNKKDILEAGIEVHYLGYYLRWDPQECYYYAVENTGFQANPVRTEGTYSKYSSIDDKVDPFHYFTTLIKFGIGRCTYDAAQEVRNDKITREEASYLVKKYDSEFPEKFYKEFLAYIDTTDEEFWATVNKYRSPHIWKEEDGEWKLRHTVAQDGTDD
ncbi:N-acetyl sugar amidotransferase [Paremcibacter congregatus]|uniref:LPS biosynthesis protein PseA n=2 Tax=Paremcibacter congregatus TaxID=2043170 RepID=A0A2G4YR67_9PROT|nr:N-acetyl sugar amidotransferase [Paremcibacter congregatus]PHZ84808.1 LPS biosynthesis protein PseA [Paremcibacter congregatus]QDE29126.1 N-acetyl sugar amidotransferase [Paremcibacter congregatus]